MMSLSCIEIGDFLYPLARKSKNVLIILWSSRGRNSLIEHELFHILAPNQGKVFKCFMDAYLPAWLDYEEALKTNYYAAV